MDRKRYHDLNDHFYDGAPEWELTEEEIKDGWHWCHEWDLLLVGPIPDGEWGDNPDVCMCGHKKPV